MTLIDSMTFSSPLPVPPTTFNSPFSTEKSVLRDSNGLSEISDHVEAPVPPVPSAPLRFGVVNVESAVVISSL